MHLFNIFIYIYFFVTIFFYVKRRDFLSPGQIAFIFVIINIFLYLQAYSGFIDISKIDSSTLFLFNSIILIFLFVTIFTKGNNIQVKDLTYRLKNKRILLLLNLINIGLVFVENYVGGGVLIPTLYGIDIHTFSMPLISLYTRSIGFLIIFNYLFFINSKQKRYILLSVLVVLLPIITRSARMTSVIAIIQFMIFYIIINKRFIYNNFKKIVKLALISIAVVVFLTSIAQYRMKNYNNYFRPYSDTILYTGYEDNLGVLPMYYGYFVLGYENLNLSIQNIKFNSGIHTYGIYTMAPIFTGIFKFDNIFDNYPARSYANSFRLRNVSTATVPTGFYEFFLDFGDFAFISIFIYAGILLIFYNKIRKDSFYLGYYAILAGAWALMSFQNVLIEVTTFYNLIFLFIFRRLLINKTKDTKELE